MRVVSATPHLLRSNRLTMGFRAGLGLCAAFEVVAGPDAAATDEAAEAEAASAHEAAHVAIVLTGMASGLGRSQDQLRL